VTTGIEDRPISADLFRGLAELERTVRGWLPHRLPARARAQCTDPQLAAAEAQPSGVRLAFRTRATVVELELLRTRTVLAGVPERPDGTVDLTIGDRLVAQAGTSGGDVVRVDMSTGQAEFERGAPATVRFDGLSGRDEDLEIWLPFHERTEIVALRTDAPITPLPVGRRRAWLHHGSSISQGSNAASPSTTWPAVAAALGGVEVINLGLAGSAMLDPFTARTMRDTPADAISVKIGINLVNADVMRARAFGPAVHGFLDTIRDGHPDTPLLVVGPLYCPIHEDTPGPGAFDPAALGRGAVRFVATGDPAAASRGSLTLSVIREQLADLVAARMAEDPNLHYLDGHDLYGPSDFAAHPLPDALHPDAATHLLIGERFARVAFAPGGPLAGL
jgi:hypothetical protein